VTLRGASCHRAHVAVGSLACARRSARRRAARAAAGVGIAGRLAARFRTRLLAFWRQG